MFDFNSLKIVQVEITNRCQASCPMCLRNIHGGIENPLLKLNDWTFENFKNIFNSDVLLQIENINFCGVFGDPILNNDLIKMCRYVKDNSDVSINIHTNGSARNVEWWKELAASLPQNHIIEFALDGLEDTHSLYRIGTDFNTIIRNATTFISNGGIANWMFIRFKHNEHQIETARQMAIDIGFKKFNVKTSKRFGKKFPVLNKEGNAVYYFEQPSSSDIQPVEFINLENYKNWKGEVQCYIYDAKELYIDAHGHLLPCCLIASFLYANYDVNLYKKYNLIDGTSIIGIGKEVQDEVFQLVEELGGFESLNSKIYSIKDIMARKIWKELMHWKWSTNSSSVCKILCSNQSPYISVQDQVNRA